MPEPPPVTNATSPSSQPIGPLRLATTTETIGQLPLSRAVAPGPPPFRRFAANLRRAPESAAPNLPARPQRARHQAASARAVIFVILALAGPDPQTRWQWRTRLVEFGVGIERGLIGPPFEQGELIRIEHALEYLELLTTGLLHDLPAAALIELGQLAAFPRRGGDCHDQSQRHRSSRWRATMRGRRHRRPLLRQPILPRRPRPEASIEPVKAHRPAGHDPVLGFFRKALHPASDHVGSAREKAVGMRVVGRPQDLVGADIIGQNLDAALDRLERDPAIALEDFARTHRQPGIVETLVVKMAVHAVEPWGDPAAAGFEETDPQFRVTVGDAAPDHTHAGEHHLHCVADDVARPAAVKPIDADSRHAARGALMEADRHIEVFGRLPERLVALGVDHLVAVRVGTNETGAEAEFFAREFHLFDRQFDRLQWQHRHPEQPVGIGLAVIGEPQIVGMAHRSREFGVVDRAGKQAKARIKESRIDAVGIHIGDALMRVEAAGLAVLVLHRVSGDHALARADRADAADTELRVADRMLFDNQPLLAIFALDDFWRPVAELGRHVLVPEVERFENMAVGVDDVVLVAHYPAPFTVNGSRERQDRQPNARLVSMTLWPAAIAVNPGAVTPVPHRPRPRIRRWHASSGGNRGARRASAQARALGHPPAQGRSRIDQGHSSPSSARSKASGHRPRRAGRWRPRRWSCHGADNAIPTRPWRRNPAAISGSFAPRRQNRASRCHAPTFLRARC